MKLSRLSSYCAWLADEAPGVHANVNFHDEVAEAAGIRLGLVRRVRRNEQPVAGFHFVGLRADDRLVAIHVVEHEHAEVASLNVDRPAAKRLGTSAACFFG